MRICFLGSYRGHPDEGMKNMAFYLERELSRSHTVLHLNARRSLPSPGFWRRLRSFRPDIVHVFLGPFVSTFVIARILAAYCRGAKVVVSQLQPPTPRLLLPGVLPLLRPDLVTVQSEASRLAFDERGCRTVFLCGGVDIEKFVPVGEDEKLALRGKHCLSADDFVVLHVGHIKRGRNVSVLAELNRMPGVQVVVVGSPSFGAEPAARAELVKGGCRVLTEYLPDLPEFYALADCYVFPTLEPMHAIEVPLSVLEAMARNLPVVTTRFGGLPEMFPEGDGVSYAAGNQELVAAVAELAETPKGVRTPRDLRSRERVLPYSWPNLAAELETTYRSLLAG